jgi:uncharacterized protein YoxC
MPEAMQLGIAFLILCACLAVCVRVHRKTNRRLRRLERAVSEINFDIDGLAMLSERE